MIDVNQTYCGDYFTIYTNIESSCCTPETNIILYVNGTYIEKKKNSNPTSESLARGNSYQMCIKVNLTASHVIVIQRSTTPTGSNAALVK